MPKGIRLYFEGAKSLRSGFDAFFQELKLRARNQRCHWDLIDCGSREEAASLFGLALRNHKDSWNFLLLDKEGPIENGDLTQLCSRNKWDESIADSIFWMAQTMEAWFHADREKLGIFYGAEFLEKNLKKNKNVEQIPKRDIEKGLSAATRGTERGDYYRHKSLHGTLLLQRVRPELVKASAPNCLRIFDSIGSKIGR